ncbi:CheY-like superfamily, partial [Pilobolus umbonatus]
DQISRLEQAVHGVAALELLKLRTFDIILLDIDMPCLNGIETAKYIRQSYKQYEILTANRSIPIIAVTTNDSEDSRKIYYKTGMNDCIRKPVNLSLLEQALYKALTL